LRQALRRNYRPVRGWIPVRLLVGRISDSTFAIGSGIGGSQSSNPEKVFGSVSLMRNRSEMAAGA